MVQLKVVSELNENGWQTEFQYLYGAIKRLNDGSCNKCFWGFQYLYGAIKSYLSCVVSIIKVRFQYLYGAIKR
ncbi:hypothetical protein NJB85_17640, partial [Myroides odoratimimus]|uniref:hypothetical protein n=1 Tax=Myroides odoratimimus TaxID=76832 RepID=UPI002096EB38